MTGDQATVVLADRTVADLLRNLQPKRISQSELEDTTRRYLEFLLTRYRYLDFRGMGMSDRVALRLPLTEMYVPLKARIEMPARRHLGATNDAGRAQGERGGSRRHG